MTITDSPESTAASALAPGATRPFETLMAVEGRWTGDERLIMVDALSWEGLLPIPLTVDHGNGITTVVGRVDEVERVMGTSPEERFIVGRGVLDLGVDSDGESGGQDAERAIEDGFWHGVSIELDDMTNGGVDPATVDDDDSPWMMVVESARLRCLALVTTAAFAEAYITLGTVETDTPVPAIDGPTPIPHDEIVQEEEDIPGLIIVASGHTITLRDLPPADWFTEPLDVAMEGALTLTDEGRIYALLAPDNVPHRGYRDSVVVAPLRSTDYAPFMGGKTPVAGGGYVNTGNITFNCGHGPEGQAAQEHYDNSCSVVATVAVGERTEPPYGVWAAGALMPGVTPDDVRRMMACRLSGHWEPSRKQGFTHELIAALLVPVPGFAAASKPYVTIREGALVASAVPVRFGGCDCDAASLQEEMRLALEEMGEMIVKLDARTEPLRALAAAAIRDSMKD